MSELLKTHTNGQWELLSKKGGEGLSAKLKPAKKDKFMEGEKKEGELMEYSGEPKIPVGKTEERCGVCNKIPCECVKKSVDEKIDELEKKHVGFKALQEKLEHEGKSKESAGSIAYAVGKKKYGKAGMAEKAHKSEEMVKFSAGGQWYVGKDKGTQSPKDSQ